MSVYLLYVINQLKKLQRSLLLLQGDLSLVMKTVKQEGCMCFGCTGEGEALTYSNSTSENTQKKPNEKGGEDLNKYFPKKDR